jgi:hypothetical protein
MLFGLAIAAASVQAAMPDVCASHVCIDEDRVLVVAFIAEDAARAHDVLIAGRERFAGAMGVMPGRTALILDPDTHPDALPGIMGAGFDSVILWTLTPESVWRENAFAGDDDMPEAIRENILAAYFNGNNQLEFDALVRYAGLVWFSDGWDWPEPVFSDDQLGVAPAPDWLDLLAETAAESGATGRGASWRLCPSNPDALPLGDLSAYFDWSYPAAPLHGEDADEWLYALNDLARGLLDYAADRSGGAPVWGDLTGEIAGGGDFDAWLSRRGPNFGLPGDVEALAADFSVWLDGACA